MKDIIIITFLGTAVALVIVGISMHRFQKSAPPHIKEKLSKGAFPWWYYIGVLGAGALALGPFNYVVKLLGIVLMIILGGLGRNWKLNQKN